MTRVLPSVTPQQYHRFSWMDFLSRSLFDTQLNAQNLQTRKISELDFELGVPGSNTQVRIQTFQKSASEASFRNKMESTGRK